MAGLAVAAELCSSGSPFLVVEAGPDGDRRHVRATDASDADRLWMRPELDAHFVRPWRSATPPHYTGLSGLRRRVGGRSSYWHGVTLPIEDWAMGGPEWPSAVRDALRGSDGEPGLYQRTTDMLRQWSGTPADRPATTGLMLGRHHLTDVPTTVRDEPGGDGARWSAYTPLSELPEGTDWLRADCEVLGIRLRGRAVTGVRCRTSAAEFDIDADTVLLTAGTIESSRLAIQALTEVGALAQPQLPSLVDKVVHGVRLRIALSGQPSAVVAAAERGAFLRAEVPDLRSNLFASFADSDGTDCSVDIWLMGEQTRRGASSISCAPADRWPWAVTVTGRFSAADEALRGAQRLVLQLLVDELLAPAGRSAPLHFDETDSATLADIITPGRAEREVGVAQPYTFPLGAEQHEGGTLALGDVLDANFQFRDITGLYASGPAVFPRSGAANPAMTILALAPMVARSLMAREPREV